MSRFCVVFVACGLIFPIVVNSANILLLLGIPSPSHHIWNTRIVNELAARGHNLTVLSVDLQKSPPKNAHYIHLEKAYEAVQNVMENKDMSKYLTEGAFAESLFLYEYMKGICIPNYKSEGFKTLLSYPDNFKFDLVIYDSTGGPYMLGFLLKFNYPPLIAISPYKYIPTSVDPAGGHYYPAYIPMPHLAYSTSMTFLQRLRNTVMYIIDHVYKDYIFMPELNKLMSHYYGKKMLNIQEIEQRTALLLLNIHPATDFPVPLPPNIIDVGGLQIAAPKPLPQDLDNFMRKSKNGAVLISFGTNIDSHMFDDDKQKMIITAVKKFSTYNFIWKFEKDPSNAQIPNLLVTKWLPQSDILAHPKIKAFVTHSGGLSTHEAIWHGVPMIAVPFFMDQRSNSNGAILAGVAKKVDVVTMTATDLEDAIRAILEDPVYAERMKIQSQRFKDRPMKPLDTAIWWIEYILRDPNPTHLRSPTIDLGIWRSNCYDLIFYSIALLVLIACITRKIIQKCCKLLTSDKKKKVKFS